MNQRDLIPNSIKNGAARPALCWRRNLAHDCKFNLLAILLLTTVPSFSQTQPSVAPGAIEGVILDETGSPLPDATVYVYTDTSTSRWQFVLSISDATGSFILNALPQGSYYILSRKVSDGYADDFYAFATTNPARHLVNVEAGKTTKAVIRRGPKCASLDLSVTDENGTPKTDYALAFERPDLGPSAALLVSADFPHGPNDPPMRADWPRGLKPLPVLVPIVPFRVTVNADGYEPWQYGGAKWQGKAGLIRLKSGQILKLKVRLRKK